jgi:futalosine hydrolase
MIALLAAVAEETDLIRETLEDSAPETVNGMVMLTGRIHGQAVCLTHGGIGKAAAAAATITLLHYCRPEALLLFGCGGAYPHSGLEIGDLALAETEIFGDEGVLTPHGFDDLAAMGLPMRQGDESFFNSWPTDEPLQERSRPTLLDVAGKQGIKLATGSFVTVSTCTGTTARAIQIEQRTGGICENMEGAAVALACRQLSVPLLEMRGISNLVEDRDTSRWDLAAGMTVAQQAVIGLLQKWPGQ